MMEARGFISPLASLVEHGFGQEAAGGGRPRADDAAADDRRVVYVLGLQLAAVAVADLAFQEEEAEAVELHLVAPVVDLVFFDDGDDDDAAAGDAGVRGRFRLYPLLVLVVGDV